jgi:phosphatidylserine decarboxylase
MNEDTFPSYRTNQAPKQIFQIKLGGFLQTFFQNFVPHHLLSRLAGWIANCKQPRIKNSLIKYFIHHYGVDMSLALQEDPEYYQSFNDFFTRALKPEKRMITADPRAIASPVDGSISEIGSICKGQVIRAKQVDYNLQALLGGSNALASQFEGGNFVTFYLAPKDYHRVHSPCDGELSEMIYVPGRLFSVNPKTAERFPQLFVQNERIITLFQTLAGPMVVVLIGAMLVGSMSTVWEGVITPAAAQIIRHWHYNKNSVLLTKGQELGHFQMGSTVIVLFSANRVRWSSRLVTLSQTEFGQCIGWME